MHRIDHQRTEFQGEAHRELVGSGLVQMEEDLGIQEFLQLDVFEERPSGDRHDLGRVVGPIDLIDLLCGGGHGYQSEGGVRIHVRRLSNFNKG